MRRRLPLPLLLVVFMLASSGFREPLTWPAPTLGSGAKVIKVPAGGGEWGVPTKVDCDVRLPDVPVTGRVKVVGCDDLRIVGGEIKNTADHCAPGANLPSSPALYLQDFAGTAHVEGVKIRGPRFSDGIWMVSEKPGSIGQVQGTWVGGLAACIEPVSFDEAWPEEHPDCLQTWNGPRVLRFDKNTCWTPYQGYYLDTGALAGASGEVTPAKTLDIRRTNVHLNERIPNGRGCFMVWSAASTLPTNLERVHCATGTRHFPWAFAPRVDLNPAAWGEVQQGVPARGDEVSPSEAGIGYTRVRGDAPGTPGAETPARRVRRAWLDGPSVKRLVRARGRVFGLRRTLARGLVVRVRCLSACRIRARVLRSKAVQVAGGRARLRSAGERAVSVKFSRRAKRRLRGARRVRLTLRVTIAAGGAKGVVSRRLILRRARR